MFRHIVLFRVWDDVTDARIGAAIADLRQLGEHSAVVEWTIALSTDTRKGRIIIEDGAFADAESFRDWRSSEHHRKVADRMAEIADWWVGDHHT